MSEEQVQNKAKPRQKRLPEEKPTHNATTMIHS